MHTDPRRSNQNTHGRTGRWMCDSPWFPYFPYSVLTPIMTGALAKLSITQLGHVNDHQCQTDCRFQRNSNFKWYCGWPPYERTAWVKKKDQWGGKIDLARKSFTFLTSFMDIFGSSNNPNPYIPIYTYCSIHCTRTPICNINLGLVYC